MHLQDVWLNVFKLGSLDLGSGLRSTKLPSCYVAVLKCGFWDAFFGGCFDASSHTCVQGRAAFPSVSQHGNETFPLAAESKFAAVAASCRVRKETC